MRYIHNIKSRNRLKTLEVDFKSLAYNGKHRLKDTDDGNIKLGELILLIEKDGNMQLKALVVEYDGDFVWFEIIK